MQPTHFLILSVLIGTLVFCIVTLVLFLEAFPLLLIYVQVCNIINVIPSYHGHSLSQIVPSTSVFARECECASQSPQQ